MPVDNPEGSVALRQATTSKIMITAEQIRAARAILRLEQVTLAEMSGLSVETIKRLERQSGMLQATQGTIDSIKKALELAGIEFLDSSSDAGSGVRLVTADIVIDRIVLKFAAQFAEIIRPALEAKFKEDPHLLTITQHPRAARHLERLVADVINRYTAELQKPGLIEELVELEIFGVDFETKERARINALKLLSLDLEARERERARINALKLRHKYIRE